MLCRWVVGIMCATLLCAAPALALAAVSLPFSAEPDAAPLPFLNADATPPILRVLYTASTRGALFPCPT